MITITHYKTSLTNSKMGQNTGISNAENNDMHNATTIPAVQLYHNLNSGNLRTNGRNSSVCLVGRAPLLPPSSSSSIDSICRDSGRNLGVRNARNIFRRYMPNEYVTRYQPCEMNTRRRNNVKTAAVPAQR